MKFSKTLFFLFFTYYLNAQQLDSVVVYKVYDNILNAIGNIHPRPPELILKNSQKQPASYNPYKKTISIEKKVLEVCHSFGPDSLNALAYILAHELAHHYRGHGWMTQFASLDFRNGIDKNKSNQEQRLNDETEADIYAGFYAHISGYNALSVADRFLERIYDSYGLPDSIPSYPTLTERKQVVIENQTYFEELKQVFDIANVLMASGQYDYAEELYIYILDKGFTSREVHNNLGLCYVYQALDHKIENRYLNVMLPFELDLYSRLAMQDKTRSIMSTDQAIDNLYSAIKAFKTALHLDLDYSLAKKNIYFSELALSLLEEDVRRTILLEDIMSLENVCEFCVKGIGEYQKNKLRKSKSLFEKGSSYCHICQINSDFDNKKTKNYHVNKNYSIADCVFFEAFDCDVYEKLISTKLCIKYDSNLKLIRLKKKNFGKKSCLNIKEIDTLNNELINSPKIYVGDSVNRIIDHSKNLKIITSGNQEYISLTHQNLVYLIQNEVVSKLYVINRFDYP